MKSKKTFVAIDLKSFYASVECRERNLDPMDVNLVVADESRTSKTICLAVSPALKTFGILGRVRLFEVIKRLDEVNLRRQKLTGKSEGKSYFLSELKNNARLEMDVLIATPRMKKYVTKDISKKLDMSRLSFAKENYLKEFLDVTPGSVSVLGLLNDKDNRVDLIIDSDVIKADFIRCHPCKNTSTLKISTKDFLNKIIPALGKEAKIIDN